MILSADIAPLVAAATGSGHAGLFLTLFVMYVSAKLAAELFERLKQPVVVGRDPRRSNSWPQRAG